MLFADGSVSELTRVVDDAFLWIGGACIVMLVLITIAMIYIAIRYGHRKHPQATHIEGNNRLEITWTVIPTIIVLLMFFKGYEGFKLMRSIPPGAMEVDVLARQWSWTFTYPDTEVSSTILYVPINTPIKFNLTAPDDDVIHSFYVPAFRVKEDCVPGRTNHMWFKPEKEGEYNIFCAEFCGRDHAKMISVMKVLSQDEFDKWMQQQIADKNKPVDLAKAKDPNSEEIQQRNAETLYNTYCVSCHGKGGEGGLVAGARDFRKLKDWKRSPKLSDIYRTLSEGIPNTQMRPFNNLSGWDRFALAHYVAAFYKGADRPQPTDEEWAALKKEYRLGEKPTVQKRISIDQAMKAMATEAAESPKDG